jgi:hypothetical protein
MKTRLLLLFLLAVPLAAETWSGLGSSELGPAPGNRLGLRAAASRDGMLAAWWDTRTGRYDLYAARMTGDAEVVDRAGLLIGSAGTQLAVEPIAVGSDGRDYLVIWRDANQLFRTTIDADGTIETRAAGEVVLPLAGKAIMPVALAWDGERYAFAYAVQEFGGVLSTYTYAQLLDRRGEPLSGPLRLTTGVCFGYCSFEPRIPMTAVSAAAGEWLAGPAGTFFFLQQSMFPPAGKLENVPPSAATPVTGHIAGVDAAGYYAIGREYRPEGGIVLRRFGPKGQLVERPLGLPWQWSLHETVAAGRMIYFTARRYEQEGTVWRLFGLRRGSLANGGTPGAPAEPRDLRALIAGPAGPTLFWSDGRDLPGAPADPYATNWVRWRDEFYAAPVGSDLWNRGGALVSASPAMQIRPEIARGAGTSWLAVWIEESGRQSLMAAALDRDARAGEAAVVGSVRGVIDDVRVAFDGVRYLVVWHQSHRREAFDYTPGGAIYGRFVDGGGRPAGEPFLIARHSDTAPLASLVWTGDSYRLSTHGALFRIAASGMILESSDEYDYEAPSFVAVMPGTGALAGLTADIEVSVVSAGPLELVSYRPLDNPKTRFGYGWYDVAPAVAAGGGTWIGVFYEWGGEADLYLGGSDGWKYLPYSSRGARPHAEWNGREFVVSAGAVIARHRSDAARTLIDVRTLGDHTVECSAAPDGTDAAIVLRRRGRPGYELPRVEAARVEFR